MDWNYCDKCGWQADEPGIATAKCCTQDSLRYVGFRSQEELAKWLPIIKQKGLKRFVDEWPGHRHGLGSSGSLLLEDGEGPTDFYKDSV